MSLIAPKKILKASVSLFLLGWTLYYLNWNVLRGVFLKIHPTIFVAAVLICFLHIVIMSVRWYIIVAKIVPLRPVQHITYYLYSNFLNTFTPATIGGDTYRVFCLRPYADSALSVILSIVKERIIGLVGYFLCYIVCLIVLVSLDPDLLNNKRYHIFLYSGAIILFTMLLLFILPLLSDYIFGLLPHKYRAKLSNIYNMSKMALDFKSYGNMGYLMGLSLFALSMWLLVVNLIAQSLNARVSILCIGIIVVLVELLRMIPISIQGIGVREGMYAYFFGILGKTSEVGFIVGMISYLALSISLMLCGLIGWLLNSE